MQAPINTHIVASLSMSFVLGLAAVLPGFVSVDLTSAAVVAAASVIAVVGMLAVYSPVLPGNQISQ